MAVVQRLSPPWDRLEMIPDRCERGKIPPVRVGTDGLYQGLTVRSSRRRGRRAALDRTVSPRSEEHTSELQSLRHLVCRLLLEKKKPQHNTRTTPYHTNNHTNI